MTRLKHLRSILQGIVLTVVGCNGVEEITPDGNQCFDMFDQQYVLAEPLEPALHLRVESCRMDRAACEELCNYVMQEAGVGYGADTCDVEFEGGETRVDVTWVVQTFADGCSVEGRRPAGLVSPQHGAARDAAGAWLAHAAWLEGASIYAFVHLANELAAFGAPRALVQQSLAAAEDEIRHARTMTQLARRYGATPPRVQIDPVAPRSLAELAVENMLEGCVRETWGAVLALYQAQTARDPVVRAAYAIIARDELRHASLAWAIDRWIAPQLDDAERARVTLARITATEELLESAELAVAVAALGLPDQNQTRELLARTRDSLWSSPHIHGGVS